MPILPGMIFDSASGRYFKALTPEDGQLEDTLLESAPSGTRAYEAERTQANTLAFAPFSCDPPLAMVLRWKQQGRVVYASHPPAAAAAGTASLVPAIPAAAQLYPSKWAQPHRELAHSTIGIQRILQRWATRNRTRELAAWAAARVHVGAAARDMGTLQVRLLASHSDPVHSRDMTCEALGLRSISPTPPRHYGSGGAGFRGFDTRVYAAATSREGLPPTHMTFMQKEDEPQLAAVAVIPPLSIGALAPPSPEDATPPGAFAAVWRASDTVPRRQPSLHQPHSAMVSAVGLSPPLLGGTGGGSFDCWGVAPGAHLNLQRAVQGAAVRDAAVIVAMGVDHGLFFVSARGRLGTIAPPAQGGAAPSWLCASQGEHACRPASQQPSADAGTLVSFHDITWQLPAFSSDASVRIMRDWVGGGPQPPGAPPSQALHVAHIWLAQHAPLGVFSLLLALQGFVLGGGAPPPAAAGKAVVLARVDFPTLPGLRVDFKRGVGSVLCSGKHALVPVHESDSVALTKGTCRCRFVTWGGEGGVFLQWDVWRPHCPILVDQMLPELAERLAQTRVRRDRSVAPGALRAPLMGAEEEFEEFEEGQRSCCRRSWVAVDAGDSLQGACLDESAS